MKNKLRSIITACLAMLVLVACNGCSTPKTQANVNAAVTTGGAILMIELSADQRTVVANYLSAAAAAIRTIDPAKPPTVEQFKKLITSFVKSDATADNYARIAALVTAVYETQIASKLGDNAKANIAALETLADELDTLAKPYLK